MKKILFILLNFFVLFNFVIAKEETNSKQKYTKLIEAPPPPSEDMATLYFVRGSAFGGGGLTLYMYVDDEFIGIVPNGSFSYTFVKEGRRVLWYPAVAVHPIRFQDFVGGETYYFLPWAGNFSVPKEVAENFMKKGLKYVQPTEKHKKKSIKKLKKYKAKHEKMLKKDLQKKVPVHFEILENPFPTNPKDPEKSGYIKVPKRSKMMLVNTSNMWTRTAVAGEKIKFKVEKDFVVNGVTIFPKGYNVYGYTTLASKSGGGGRNGIMQVKVQEIIDGEGRKIPLWSDIMVTGHHRSQAGIAMGAIFGLLGSAMVQGKEGFASIGTQYLVFFTDDVWVKPISKNHFDKKDDYSKYSKIQAEWIKKKVVLNPYGSSSNLYNNLNLKKLDRSKYDLESFKVVAVDDRILDEPVKVLLSCKTSSGMRTGVYFKFWDILKGVRLEKEKDMTFKIVGKTVANEDVIIEAICKIIFKVSDKESTSIQNSK